MVKIADWAAAAIAADRVEAYAAVGADGTRIYIRATKESGEQVAAFAVPVAAAAAFADGSLSAALAIAGGLDGGDHSD